MAVHLAESISGAIELTLQANHFIKTRTIRLCKVCIGGLRTREIFIRDRRRRSMHEVIVQHSLPRTIGLIHQFSQRYQTNDFHRKMISI